VGFGMPVQERRLMENWDRIRPHQCQRGPHRWNRLRLRLRRTAPRPPLDDAPCGGNGLAWLVRLLIELRRLWKRTLTGNLLFLWWVFEQRLELLGLDGQ
jgi:UDP-N-acetyl-D-mannosaminuronic acid transferase (WecB/TagA/CpsF family)